MKRTFVKTTNASRFLSGVQALNQRGAEEACLVVVDGEPGLGKSAVIQWWARSDRVGVPSREEGMDTTMDASRAASGVGRRPRLQLRADVQAGPWKL